MQCDDKLVTVFFCANEREYQEFWRTVLKHSTLDSANFDELIEHAFWNLEVSQTARNRWDRMGMALVTIKGVLVTHLGYLSDQYVQDADSYGGNVSELQRSASAAGVNMSPENALSVRARRDRRVMYLGKEYVCLWHTKISHTKGRIHFHRLDGDKVLIGIVTEHLSTD